jgi:hypothetical protein
VSHRRPRSRPRSRPPKLRLPRLTPTVKQLRASLPWRWSRSSARPMIRPPFSLLRRRAPCCSRLRTLGHVRCPLPGHVRCPLPARMDSPVPVNREQTSCQPPAEPAPRPPQARSPRCRRLARVMSVAHRPDLGHGQVRPVDCPAVRDRLGVAPGFHARVTTHFRLLRAWADRAHLGPALQIRPSLVGLAHHWVVRPCQAAGQVCPACRGQIPP